METRLGIVDWGIGGLAYYRLLPPRMRRSVTYFSDSGFTPYGKTSSDDLQARLVTVILYLRSLNVGPVVVACNSASTVLPSLNFPNVAGVIEPTVLHLLSIPEKRIGIMGGERTVQSEIYKGRLLAAGKTVLQSIAQPLSAFVERGELASSILSAQIARITEPLRDCAVLVLACTHYTALTSQIATALPNAAIVDPSDICKDSTHSLWSTDEENINDSFWTTGDPASSERSARLAFGLNTGKWNGVTL